MEEGYDLETFAKILTDKGYSGYFHTAAAYPDKLKESISRFLEACRNGTDEMRGSEFSLKTYLQYNGDDKPRIISRMWVNYHKEKFELQSMTIEKIDRYGQSMKESKLTGLSVSTAPAATDAIAMVKDELKQKMMPRRKGFGL